MRSYFFGSGYICATIGSKKSIVGRKEEDDMEEREDAEEIAEMKEDFMAGVRGDAKPLRRIAILMGEDSREPILVSWRW